MKTYCTNCGFKIEYPANQKPNFCPSCGHSFNGASPPRSQASQEVEEADDEPTFHGVSEGFELDVEIMEKRSGSNKLSDIMGTSSGAESANLPNKTKKRGRPKKIDKEKIWEDFRNEAGGAPHKEANE